MERVREDEVGAERCGDSGEEGVGEDGLRSLTAEIMAEEVVAAILALGSGVQIERRARKG